MICKRLSAAMQSSDFHDLRLYWLSWNEKHSKKKKLPNSGIQSSTGLFLVSDLSVRRRVPNLLVSLKREKLKSSFVWISFLEKLHLYSSQIKWWDCKEPLCETTDPLNWLLYDSFLIIPLQKVSEHDAFRCSIKCRPRVFSVLNTQSQSWPAENRRKMTLCIKNDSRVNKHWVSRSLLSTRLHSVRPQTNCVTNSLTHNMTTLNLFDFTEAVSLLAF